MTHPTSFATVGQLRLIQGLWTFPMPERIAARDRFGPGAPYLTLTAAKSSHVPQANAWPLRPVRLRSGSGLAGRRTSLEQI
jgi:hypothetical protein